jgi:hypothetical protein
MNRITSFRSILMATAILLAAGCGQGESPREEPSAAIRPTPSGAAEKLIHYRQRGIEPRRARFFRECDE